MTNHKKALIVGSTGLIGKELLNLLLQDERYETIYSWVRKPTGNHHPKLVETVIDFNHLTELKTDAEEVYSCLGTILKTAGSKENQYVIDHDYPVHIAEIVKRCGSKKYILVSSGGANANSANFYLRTKGTLEQDIAALNFNCFISVRPSFLIGNRLEKRTGEHIAKFLVKVLSPLLFGPLRKYRGIEASRVAEAMIYFSKQNIEGNHYIESDMLAKVSVT